MKQFRLVLISSLAGLLIVSCTRAATTQTTDSRPVAESTTESTATASPTAPPAEMAQMTENAVISGRFISGEHPTQGGVQIINQDGKRILQLDQQFTTSTAGPDLVVALHRSANVIGETDPPAYPLQEGDYVVLAPLQQYSGTQSYEIPANINLEDFQSAVIWCRQFNATFGAAALQPS
jgi:hypothetical protein